MWTTLTGSRSASIPARIPEIRLRRVLALVLAILGIVMPSRALRG